MKSFLLILVSAALSACATRYVLTSKNNNAVYVIGSVTVTDPARLPEYQAQAQPLAHSSGGYEPLGFSQPRLIEGQLPAEGLFFVERFESDEALNGFLNSAAMQDLKNLRDQVAKVHFMLAIDAYAASSKD